MVKSKRGSRADDRDHEGGNKKRFSRLFVL